uniref:AF4/FMR2 family member lilli n=1 Tax=Trichuris muris TaxID=70415 RepID=A0A5S6QQS6_TRIMR
MASIPYCAHSGLFTQCPCFQEMREMIATPLTGISTPRQDKVFDCDPKAALSYANGHQRHEMRTTEERALNGFHRHGQSSYLKLNGRNSQRVAAPVSKKSSPASESCRKSTSPTKRSASFSLLNDDLQLSEDSDAKEENCDDVEATSDEVMASSPVTTLPDESSPPVSCSSAGAMGETSPLTEAEPELPNPVDIEYAAKSVIPENPWDIDYLISKTLNKSISPGEVRVNGDTGRGQQSPTAKEQVERQNVGCRLSHEMVKQCIDDLFEEEDEGPKSASNDSASDMNDGSQRSETESSDDTARVLPVIKRKREKSRKRNDLFEPSHSGCHLTNGSALQIDGSQCKLKVANYCSDPQTLSSSPVKYEGNRMEADQWTSDVETILVDYSSLLPLLSPIRHQSSTSHQHPATPLLCRLDLNLIPRLPSPIHAKAVEVGLEEVRCRGDTDRSDAKQTCSERVPFPCVRNPKGEATPKAGNTSTGIEKSLPPVTADLDDVPILERMKKSLGNFRKIGKRTVAEKPVQTKLVSNPNGSGRNTASTDPVASVQKSPRSADYELRVQQDRSTSSNGTKRRASFHQQQALSHAKEKSPVPPPPPQAKRSRMESHSQCLLQMAPHSALRVYMDEKEPQVYLEKAKRVKHAADAQTADKSLRIILYLESVVYFVLTGHCMEKTLSAESSRPYSMLKETCELLKGVSQKYFAQSSVSVDSYVAFLNSKIEVLSLRVQALLCLKLYELRESQAVNNYRHISQYHLTAKEGNDRQCSSANPHAGSGSHGDQQQQPHGLHAPIGGLASSRQTSPGEPQSVIAHSPTPSPASSTGSSHSLAPGMVAIPQNVENMYKQQLSHLHNLMWAHLKWNLSVKKMTKEDEQFFAHLDSVCMPLHITSSINELCTFMLTAADWLRRFHSTQSKNFDRPSGIR